MAFYTAKFGYLPLDYLIAGILFYGSNELEIKNAAANLMDLKKKADTVSSTEQLLFAERQISILKNYQKKLENELMGSIGADILSLKKKPDAINLFLFSFVFIWIGLGFLKIPFLTDAFMSLVSSSPLLFPPLFLLYGIVFMGFKTIYLRELLTKKISEKTTEELPKELIDFGLWVIDVDIRYQSHALNKFNRGARLQFSK